MQEELSQEQTQQIADALAAGRKIDAIKIYRTATGQGLKEAKAFIDALVPKLVEEDPEKYQKLASGGGGCTSVLLLGLGLGTAFFTILERIG